jgi:hypothetical protein
LIFRYDIVEREEIFKELSGGAAVGDEVGQDAERVGDGELADVGAACRCTLYWLPI